VYLTPATAQTPAYMCKQESARQNSHTHLSWEGLKQYTVASNNDIACKGIYDK
jgi:hypothetical protein